MDGFPRTGVQAEALQAAGIVPNKFLLLDVPDESLVERVTGRRLDPETGAIYHVKFKPPPAEVADRCIQRSDDTAEKVITRIEAYHANLQSIIDYYKDVMVRFDGNRAPAEIAADISKALD